MLFPALGYEPRFEDLGSALLPGIPTQGASMASQWPYTSQLTLSSLGLSQLHWESGWWQYISVGPFLRWEHVQAQREEVRHPSSPNKLVAGLSPKYKLALPLGTHFLVHSSPATVYSLDFLSVPSLFLPQDLCTCCCSSWQVLPPDLYRTHSFLLTCHYLKELPPFLLSLSPLTP